MSLLSASRSHSFLKVVCLDDPILQKMLQAAVKQENKLLMELTLNPSSLLRTRSKVPNHLEKNQQNGKEVKKIPPTIKPSGFAISNRKIQPIILKKL